MAKACREKVGLELETRTWQNEVSGRRNIGRPKLRRRYVIQIDTKETRVQTQTTAERTHWKLEAPTTTRDNAEEDEHVYSYLMYNSSSACLRDASTTTSVTANIVNCFIVKDSTARVSTGCVCHNVNRPDVDSLSSTCIGHQRTEYPSLRTPWRN